MREAEHGCHVFFIAVIMARYSQDITDPALFFTSDARKYQVPVIIITVKQEAVVSVIPVFPWQKTDILGLYGKDLASVGAVKGLYLGVTLTESFPKLMGPYVFLFLFFEALQVLGISQKYVFLPDIACLDISLWDIVLWGIILRDITLLGIALWGVILRGISLRGITLWGIVLRGIFLWGVILRGISLSGIILLGISLSGIILLDTSLSGIILLGTSLSGIILLGISFCGIHHRGVNHRGIHRRGIPALRPAVHYIGIRPPILGESGLFFRLCHAPLRHSPIESHILSGLHSSSILHVGTGWNGRADRDSGICRSRVPTPGIGIFGGLSLGIRIRWHGGLVQGIPIRRHDSLTQGIPIRRHDSLAQGIPIRRHGSLARGIPIRRRRGPCRFLRRSLPVLSYSDIGPGIAASPSKHFTLPQSTGFLPEVHPHLLPGPRPCPRLSTGHLRPVRSRMHSHFGLCSIILSHVIFWLCIIILIPLIICVFRTSGSCLCLHGRLAPHRYFMVLNRIFPRPPRLRIICGVPSCHCLICQLSSSQLHIR